MKVRTHVWLVSLAILLGALQLVSTQLSSPSTGRVLRASGTSPVPPPIPIPPVPTLS
jgi:hypothetical protein